MFAAGLREPSCPVARRHLESQSSNAASWEGGAHKAATHVHVSRLESSPISRGLPCVRWWTELPTTLLLKTRRQCNSKVSCARRVSRQMNGRGALSFSRPVIPVARRNCCRRGRPNLGPSCGRTASARVDSRSDKIRQEVERREQRQSQRSSCACKASDGTRLLRPSFWSQWRSHSAFSGRFLCGARARLLPFPINGKAHAISFTVRWSLQALLKEGSGRSPRIKWQSRVET